MFDLQWDVGLSAVTALAVEFFQQIFPHFIAGLFPLLILHTAYLCILHKFSVKPNQFHADGLHVAKLDKTH